MTDHKKEFALLTSVSFAAKWVAARQKRLKSWLEKPEFKTLDDVLESLLPNFFTGAELELAEELAKESGLQDGTRFLVFCLFTELEVEHGVWC